MPVKYRYAGQVPEGCWSKAVVPKQMLVSQSFSRTFVVPVKYRRGAGQMLVPEAMAPSGLCASATTAGGVPGAKSERRALLRASRFTGLTGDAFNAPAGPERDRLDGGWRLYFINCKLQRLNYKLNQS